SFGAKPVSVPQVAVSPSLGGQVISWGSDGDCVAGAAPPPVGAAPPPIGAAPPPIGAAPPPPDGTAVTPSGRFNVASTGSDAESPLLCTVIGTSAGSPPGFSVMLSSGSSTEMSGDFRGALSVGDVGSSEEELGSLAEVGSDGDVGSEGDDSSGASAGDDPEPGAAGSSGDPWEPPLFDESEGSFPEPGLAGACCPGGCAACCCAAGIC